MNLVPGDKVVFYPCDQCGYRATHKSHLLTHVKSKHEGVKYPCDHCDLGNKEEFFIDTFEIKT